jgi:hypothetical protein
MSTRFLDPRRCDPQAHANPAFRAAWIGNDLVPLDGRDPRLPSRGRTFPPDAFRRLEDRQFLDMSRNFDAQGGWVSGDEMSRRMRRHWDQPISVLANWVMKREIVNIVWHARILIPVFQFSSEDLQIRPVVRAALAELDSVFDDWEIAVWFAQPNAWLHEQPPLDLAARDDEAVIDAARADRFIARD